MPTYLPYYGSEQPAPQPRLNILELSLFYDWIILGIMKSNFPTLLIQKPPSILASSAEWIRSSFFRGYFLDRLVINETSLESS
jgi:hypothetical protein